jgi:prepilin-type processing-associated H-X9-DG protein
LPPTSQTIDDAAWAPPHSITGNRNVLSNRHERSIENTANWNDGRGNVAFVDGRAEFIPRADIILPQYYDPNVP